MIRFLDPKNFANKHKADILEGFSNVISEGQYIGGERVENFEREFASWNEVNFCCSAGNGFDALKLSLLACGVKNDQVIVPSNTFIATWLAISDIGAKPLPVEPDPDIGCITENEISKKISKETKAVVVVTLYGNSPDLEKISKLVDSYKIPLICDAAQSHGTKVKGLSLEKFCKVVAYSFYPGKTLGALGDAGGITTDDYEIFEKIKLLKNYGSSKKYVHAVKGINSRLDPIQATYLSIRLKHIEEEINIEDKAI